MGNGHRTGTRTMSRPRPSRVPTAHSHGSRRGFLPSSTGTPKSPGTRSRNPGCCLAWSHHRPLNLPSPGQDSPSLQTWSSVRAPGSAHSTSTREVRPRGRFWGAPPPPRPRSQTCLPTLCTDSWLREGEGCGQQLRSHRVRGALGAGAPQRNRSPTCRGAGEVRSHAETSHWPLAVGVRSLLLPGRGRKRDRQHSGVPTPPTSGPSWTLEATGTSGPAGQVAPESSCSRPLRRPPGGRHADGFKPTAAAGESREASHAGACGLAREVGARWSLPLSPSFQVVGMWSRHFGHSL